MSLYEDLRSQEVDFHQLWFTKIKQFKALSMENYSVQIKAEFVFLNEVKTLTYKVFLK